jgi:type IV pilus assembly protein PilO
MKIDVKNPNFIRWALTVLVVAAVVPTYFLSSSYPFTYASRSQTIGQLDERHQQLSQELERARLLVRNLERVEQEYAILHDQWKVAATLLPDENEMPDLLRKVTAAGQQSGVEFEIFRPGAVVNQGFYSDNPVEVRINGGYHQTGVFLSRLANLNRIVNVSKLKMHGVDDQKDKDAAYSVRTDLMLTAYTQGPGNTQSAATADVGAARTITAKVTGSGGAAKVSATNASAPNASATKASAAGAPVAVATEKQGGR